MYYVENGLNSIISSVEKSSVRTLLGIIDGSNEGTLVGPAVGSGMNKIVFQLNYVKNSEAPTLRRVVYFPDPNCVQNHKSAP